MFGKTLKSISIALFLIILATAAQVQAQTCATAPVGLVSAYSGDNNALDARSRSNGTLQNGATFSPAGEVGQAFSFDGVDDQITAPDNANQNGGTNLTIEAWINPSSLAHGATILQKRTSGNVGGYLLEPTQLSGSGAANGLQFVIMIGGVYQTLNPANVLTANVWQHIAATYDGATMRIYVNGVEVGNKPQTGAIDAVAAPILIGRNAVNGTAYSGKIDEIGLYNRALSAAEILMINNAGTAGKCKPLATYAPDDQVLWLAGDGDANDISGNGNNGTLGSTTVFTVGKVGQAFQFDGNANSQILVPDTQSLRPTTAVTVDAWINPSSAGTGFQGVLFKGNSGSSGGQPYSLFVNGSNHQIVVRVGNNSTFDALGSVGGIPANVYSHVAFTYDGTTIRIYVNGVLDSSAASSIGTLAQADTNPLKIGGLGSSFAFTGGVDEVGIYNRALSVDEIASIANAGLAGKYKVQSTVPAGITAWYPGDGNTNDLQAANNGTLQGGAGFAAGKVGQAFSLNGTDAFVQAPSSAANDPTTAGSMEAWVKFNQTPSAVNRIMEIIGKGSTGSDFDLQAEPDNRFRFYVGGSNFVSSNTVIQANVWYHVAGTWDSAGLRMFVNGVLENTNAAPSIVRTPNGRPLQIGNQPTFGPRFFSGLIDEPSIYNRALTANEIRDVDYAQSGGKYKTAQNPTVSNKTKTGDVELTFANLTAAGAVHETMLDVAKLPVIPNNYTSTGLFYDVSTTAAFTGNVTECFNLTLSGNAFETMANFNNLKLLHLEAGVWLDRTTSANFATKTLCGQTTTLSPFAIVLNYQPTAAAVSISGRVLANGKGLANARVEMTGTSGKSIIAVTNSFGNFTFREVESGATYIIGVSAKRYSFAPQVVSVTDNLTGLQFDSIQ